MDAVLIVGLLAVAAALLFFPVVPKEGGLCPTEIGFLRRGTRGAVLTALTALHAKGLVVVRARGGLRQSATPAPRIPDPFERAVYHALHSPAGVAGLAARPPVRRARDELVARLAAAGLVAGPARLLTGRILLIAAAATAVVRLAAGGGAIAGLVVSLFLAAGMWPLSRRTIAGHGVLHAMRGENARRLASWRAGEPHQPPDGAVLHDGFGATSAGAGTIAVALGMVSVLVATTGIQVVDVESGGDYGGSDGGDPYLDSGHGAP